MKYILSTFLLSLVLMLTACGGGSSSSDGGGDSMDGDTFPESISGTYSGTWEGSGTSASGVFTCQGTFTLTISQSGSTIVVTYNVVTSGGSGTGQCTEAFDFSGNGTYNASTGALGILSVEGAITASLSGTASEQTGKITLSGIWSTTETASAAVIASGTWTAESL